MKLPKKVTSEYAVCLGSPRRIDKIKLYKTWSAETACSAMLVSDIVRENRAVPKDWGQPISFIFSEFKTKLIRLTLVTLTRFPGVSLPRLTTPLVFGQGKPQKPLENANFSGQKQFSLKELVHGFVSEAKLPYNKRFGCLKSNF